MISHRIISHHIANFSLGDVRFHHDVWMCLEIRVAYPMDSDYYLIPEDEVINENYDGILGCHTFCDIQIFREDDHQL